MNFIELKKIQYYETYYTYTKNLFQGFIIFRLLHSENNLSFLYSQERVGGNACMSLKIFLTSLVYGKGCN